MPALTGTNLMYLAAEYGQYASWLDAYYYADGSPPNQTVDAIVTQCSGYATNLSRAAASTMFNDANLAYQLLSTATTQANAAAQQLTKNAADVSRALGIGSAFLVLAASLTGGGGAVVDGIIGLITSYGGDPTAANNAKAANGP